MARDGNTFAKRQRETGKKQKAAEKRARHQKKKELDNVTESPNSGDRTESQKEMAK
jgi:hypothetical protein